MDTDGCPKLPLVWDNPMGRCIAHPMFAAAINVSIVGNCLFMALEHEGQHDGFTLAITVAEVDDASHLRPPPMYTTLIH